MVVFFPEICCPECINPHTIFMVFIGYVLGYYEEIGVY